MYNDIFTLLQKILQSVVKPDLLVNCKNFSDLLKLDLDSKDTFKKLKDMSIGFVILSTITKLRGTDQIRKNQISSFFNDVIKLQLLQKSFLKKVQCAIMWSEIQ